MEGEEEVIKEKEASSVRAESPSQSDKERARSGRIYLNSPMRGNVWDISLAGGRNERMNE